MYKILRQVQRAAPIWLLLSMTLAGCATPKLDVATTEPVGKYRKVYIFEPSSDPRQVQPKIVSQLQSLGFKVVVLKKDQPIESQGSGFVVSREGHILTCTHLFRNVREATLWIGNQRYEADVIKQDSEKDIAILKPRSAISSVKPLSLFQGEEYSMGQDVFTMGFPMTRLLGTSPRLNKGLINAAVGIKDNPDQLQVSTEIQPGNSGSPLFNTQREVIGMIFATLNSLEIMRRTYVAPQNVNFALKATSIRKFLQEAGIDASREKATPSSFDEAKDSIVRIETGIIPLERPPELVCSYQYHSFRDVWYRFRLFRVVFFDKESGKVVFEGGQYRDIVLMTEDAALERVFGEIRTFFAPKK